MTSLVVANAVIGGVLLGPVVGAFAWEPARFATYPLPWAVQNDLPGRAPARSRSFGALCAVHGRVRLARRRTFERRDL
jgi:hypothetical protein